MTIFKMCNLRLCKHFVCIIRRKITYGICIILGLFYSMFRWREAWHRRKMTTDKWKLSAKMSRYESGKISGKNYSKEKESQRYKISLRLPHAATPPTVDVFNDNNTKRKVDTDFENKVDYNLPACCTSYIKHETFEKISACTPAKDEDKRELVSVPVKEKSESSFVDFPFEKTAGEILKDLLWSKNVSVRCADIWVYMVYKLQDNQQIEPLNRIEIHAERQPLILYRPLTRRTITFRNFPNSAVCPIELARYGFYYPETQGASDLVRCHDCGVGLLNWTAEDDVCLEHVRCFTRCTFIRDLMGPLFVDTAQRLQQNSQDEVTMRLVLKNLPSVEAVRIISSLISTVNAPHYHRDENYPKNSRPCSIQNCAAFNDDTPDHPLLNSCCTRYRTFNVLTRNSQMVAFSGFYYDPPNRKFLCFYCSVRLEFDMDDNICQILAKHIHSSPSCGYIRQILPELVANVLQYKNYRLFLNYLPAIVDQLNQIAKNVPGLTEELQNTIDSGLRESRCGICLSSSVGAYLTCWGVYCCDQCALAVIPRYVLYLPLQQS